MNPYEFNLSLRLFHPNQDLETFYHKILEITSFIPGRIWKQGDNRLTIAGEPLEGIYENSYCFMNNSQHLQSSNELSLNDAIDNFLDKISPLKSEFEEFTKSNGRSELFVGFYFSGNSSETFYSDLIKKLSEFQIDLSLDLYPDNIGDQPISN
jgi:hypothetical protein